MIVDARIVATWRRIDRCSTTYIRYCCPQFGVALLVTVSRKVTVPVPVTLTLV